MEMARVAGSPVNRRLFNYRTSGDLFMKTVLKAALTATLATGLFATPALAANSATAPFTAKAKILKPLTLTKTSDLDFGTITLGAALSSSNVVVGRSGGATTSCGTNLTCSAPTAAAFSVSGVALQQLNVALSNVPATLVNTVDATKSVAFSVDPDASVTLDSLGAGAFDIGGSITVLSSTADGVYNGTVDVTVSYL
jgi:Domain of unknown function (DUF4402)